MEKALREKLPDGSFYATKPAHRKIMRAVRSKGNRTTEARLRGALAQAGIRGWHLNFRGAKGNPDFFFPRERVAVFVDGCFWHGCARCGHVPKVHTAFWEAKFARNRERSKQTDHALRLQGILVVHFWEHELAQSARTCVERIRAALRSRAGSV